MPRQKRTIHLNAALVGVALILSLSGGQTAGDEHPAPPSGTRIAVDRSLLDFGSVPIGQFATETIIISNISEVDNLIVQSVTFPDPVFTLVEAFTSDIVLIPQGNVSVPVRFTPTAEVTYAGDLNITSDDPTLPLLEVPLSGTGFISENNITSVVVTTSSITAHKAGSGGFAEVVPGLVSFDLLDLGGVGGVEEVLDSAELTTGKYTQIRLIIESVMVTRDGIESPATVPSGVIRLVGVIPVDVGFNTIVTLDFDTDRSVNLKTEPISFKPTVKLIVRQEPEPPAPAKPTVLAQAQQVEPTSTLEVRVTATSGRPEEVFPGDFDGDRRVGFSDFLEFAGAFGSVEGDSNYQPQFDLDPNGAVDVSDFLEFVGLFGTVY